jgi:peptidoglycan/xylan/chitin deacetylase (PgdA/CDA1 family)
MKRYLLAFIVFPVIFLTVACMLFQLGRSRTYQFFGPLTARVETSQKAVALTFDDGPTRKHTDEILQILKEENVRATFYVMGADIEENPGELEKIVAAGHEIGNHSYSHERMILVSPSFVRSEIETTDALIRKAGFTREITFRPPFGKKLFVLPFYLSQTNRRTITWDVEPETFVERSEDIIEYTVENTRNGSIILLHVMYPSRAETMKAVRPIVQKLRERGFEFVTVSELLAMEN